MPSQGAQAVVDIIREPVAAVDAVGRDRAGRIGADPADAALPVLGPGMRRALADDIEAVDRHTRGE